MADSDCKIIECCEPNPYDYNVTSGTVYENEQMSFIFDCPEGYICLPGQYPKTIVIQKGATQFVPPPFVPNNPFPFPLRKHCCTGWLTVWLPAGATLAQYLAATQQLLRQWAEAEAGCIEAEERVATRYTVSNDAQSLECPNNRYLYNISATLPKGVSLVGGILYLEAGIFREPEGSFTAVAKANANAKALAFLQNFYNACIALGTMKCGYTDWVINFTCCDYTGVNSVGLHADIDPICSSEALCAPNVLFNVDTHHDVGPYTENKTISLVGYIHISRSSMVGTTVDNTVIVTGLVGGVQMQSIQLLAAIPPNSDTEVLTISGQLLAGHTCRVQVQAGAGSNSGASATAPSLFDIVVT